ncbi:MAG: hypothetical protein JWL61_539 [Gemmatimonadetes bacterium]|nr:hypothetical protein [Gemmatimonadota bacterium]
MLGSTGNFQSLADLVERAGKFGGMVCGARALVASGNDRRG